ncbi:MAG: hypothetical protein IPL21_07170 [Saprospirales bacterium]|nr:hypothetical protein [Saprospirales bacterium]
MGNFSPYTITGNIFLDRNNNCLKEVNENSIPQITVTAQNNNNTLFASSDNNGNYTIPVADTGIYFNC